MLFFRFYDCVSFIDAILFGYKGLDERSMGKTAEGMRRTALGEYDFGYEGTIVPADKGAPDITLYSKGFRLFVNAARSGPRFETALENGSACREKPPRGGLIPL